MPTKIPKMKKEFFENIEKLSFQEIAFEVAKQLLSEDISAKKLKQIIDEAINFNAPLVKLEENIWDDGFNWESSIRGNKISIYGSTFQANLKRN